MLSIQLSKMILIINCSPPQNDCVKCAGHAICSKGSTLDFGHFYIYEMHKQRQQQTAATTINRGESPVSVMAVTNANFSFLCRNSRRAELFKLNMDGHPNQTDRRKDKCHDRQLRTLDRQAGIQTDRQTQTSDADKTVYSAPLFCCCANNTWRVACQTGGKVGRGRDCTSDWQTVCKCQLVGIPTSICTNTNTYIYIEIEKFQE